MARELGINLTPRCHRRSVRAITLSTPKKSLESSTTITKSHGSCLCRSVVRATRPFAARLSPMAVHVPMVRRRAHSGRRWGRDYLLARLITCPIFGNVIELNRGKPSNIA
jgi:hypothetical protein